MLTYSRDFFRVNHSTTLKIICHTLTLQLNSKNKKQIRYNIEWFLEVRSVVVFGFHANVCSEVLWRPWFVGNKAKGQISKRVFFSTRQIIRKTNISCHPIRTRRYSLDDCDSYFFILIILCCHCVNYRSFT